VTRFGVIVDLDHGGRWTSLRDPAGREWLWHRDEPRRAVVAPGDPFADAGGLEECIPTVRGTPDHGDAWSRRWQADGQDHVVRGDGYELRRRITPSGHSVVADYRLRAEPGWRFVWAGHALLQAPPGSVLEGPREVPASVYPGEGPPEPGVWPAPYGEDLSRLGPDDGTGIGVVLPGVAEMTLRVGDARLRLGVEVADQPYGVAIWRNLGLLRGEDGVPYRSVGIEPMLGQVFDCATAGPGQAAVVPRSGVVDWRLVATYYPCS
jgi:hypothetical protein